MNEITMKMQADQLIRMALQEDITPVFCGSWAGVFGWIIGNAGMDNTGEIRIFDSGSYLVCTGTSVSAAGNPFSEKAERVGKIDWISGNERLIFISKKIFKNKTPSFLKSCGKRGCSKFVVKPNRFFLQCGRDCRKQSHCLEYLW